MKSIYLPDEAVIPENLQSNVSSCTLNSGVTPLPKEPKLFNKQNADLMLGNFKKGSFRSKNESNIYSTDGSINDPNPILTAQRVQFKLPRTDIHLNSQNKRDVSSFYKAKSRDPSSPRSPLLYQAITKEK